MSDFVENAAKFAINAHGNQKYDNKLPYSFHLGMSVAASWRFLETILRDIPQETRNIIYAALWNHDVLEDTTVTKAQLIEATNQEVADIVEAVTEDEGATRKERKSPASYERIRNKLWATFVKLMDRIANITYSKRTGSRMLEVYRKEHVHFKTELYTEEYKEIWDYIDWLFETGKKV